MSTGPQNRARSVPASRPGRLMSLGRIAGGVAGSLAVQGGSALLQGQRPDLRGMVMTPANIRRITDELARMRGAAMKVGQLVSLDAGEVLPPELAQIMARLRAHADFMPPRQLRKVLDRAWGPGWTRQFRHFDVRPIAAASIGQVHRAQTRDGRDLAIKVQYPGVRQSIDSDVANVGTLLRLSGVLPRDMDVSGLLEEAKRQLHDEADYDREARELSRFGTFLAQDTRFRVPELAQDLSNRDVLVMSFVQGQSVESLETEDQNLRNHVASTLLELTIKEIFDFLYVQSDPNFANFQFDKGSNRIVLLDFGASNQVSETASKKYAELFRAGLNGISPEAAALNLGFFDHTIPQKHRAQILSMLEDAFAPLAAGEIVDFGDRARMKRLATQGLAMAEDPALTHIPPVETLLIQRKLGGMVLLATRLRAQVDVAGLLRQYLPPQACAR